MIFTLVKAFYSYFRYIYKQKLLSFDTYSKFEITPVWYFNGELQFFSYLDKENILTNIIYQFFKILRVRYL